MNGNALHIASIGKPGNLPALLVTLGSTLIHLPPNQTVVLHIVDQGLSGDEWVMLKGLMEKLHPQVAVHQLILGESPMGLNNKPGVASYLIPALLPQWLMIDEVWFLPPGLFILHPLEHESGSEGMIQQPFGLLPDQTRSEKFYLDRLQKKSGRESREWIPMRLQLAKIRTIPDQGPLTLKEGQDFYFWHQKLERYFEQHWLPQLSSAPVLTRSSQPAFEQFSQEHLALQYSQHQKPWDFYRTDLHALLFYDLFRELDLGYMLGRVNDSRDSYLTYLSNSAFLVPYLGFRAGLKRLFFIDDLGYEDRYQAWYWKNLRRQQKELFKHINEVEAFRNTLRQRVQDRLATTQTKSLKPSEPPKAL